MREWVSNRGDDEEGDGHREDEPQERSADVVSVVGDAVEAAGVGLILDDELLQDQRLGQGDDGAVDAIDVALEGDDAEDEGEQRRDRQRRSTTAKGMLMQRLHEARQLGEPVPLHEIGNLAAVSGRMGNGVVDLERQRDDVGANAEIDRLAEAQDAGEAPDQVDAEGEDREAEELAEQQENVAVGSREVREGADRARRRGRRGAAPRSGETAPADDP